MRVLDAHLHVFETLATFGANGEARAIGGGRVRLVTGAEFQMIPPGLGDRSFTAETLIDLMDSNGVEKGVLLQGNFYGFQNDYADECARRYPTRLLAAGTLDPFCKNAPAIAEDLLVRRGLRAIKFEVSSGAGLMSHHPAFALDGKVLAEVIALVDRQNATLVLDIGSPGMESFQPQAVANIARRHPTLRIVVCHLLAPRASDSKALEEALPLLQLPNIWFDTAALPFNVGEAYPYPTAIRFLKLARQLVGAEKLIFATDVPSVLNSASYAQLRDYVLTGQIFTPAELDGYYSGNATTAYRL